MGLTLSPKWIFNEASLSLSPYKLRLLKAEYIFFIPLSPQIFERKLSFLGNMEEL